MKNNVPNSLNLYFITLIYLLEVIMYAHDDGDDDVREYHFDYCFIVDYYFIVDHLFPPKYESHSIILKNLIKCFVDFRYYFVLKVYHVSY